MICGAAMSFSTNATNKANNIYILGNWFVQGINDTTIYAEKVYNLNFTIPDKKFALSLHYNGDNSYLFVNGIQQLKFKAKNDQVLSEKLCLVNLSSSSNDDESEKTGLYGMVYDFVVDYEPTDGIGPICGIHRYFMIK